MRSGFKSYEGIWGNPYYDEQFAEIVDHDFTQKVFTGGDALISVRPLDPSEVPAHVKARFYRDGTVEVPYSGQAFDAEKFRLEKGQWGHEHCYVCQFRIEDAHTFWMNGRGRILCDACHDHYVLGKQVF